MAPAAPRATLASPAAVARRAPRRGSAQHCPEQRAAMQVLAGFERRGYTLSDAHILPDGRLNIVLECANLQSSVLDACFETIKFDDGDLIGMAKHSMAQVADNASSSRPDREPPLDEDNRTHMQLLSLLEESGAQYEATTHAPTRTSKESAHVRGATLASGAKAMLLSVRPGDEFVLSVISAAAKMDSKALRRAGGFKSVRFATEAEVWSVTACLPGAVPPFGSLWGLRTFLDSSLEAQGSAINFNAGLRTHSVQMALHDYVAIERPVCCVFH